MPEGSVLLLEEYFAAGDARFLEELRRVRAAKRLAAFAERWTRDPRPWARDQLHAYLDGPLDNPEHKPFVKRLFKLAEAANDDATMARFLVAFDRNVRRRERRRYNWQTREMEDGYRAGRAGSFFFTVHTAGYLRRRAWRYFRRLGWHDPKRYLAAVLQALPLYRDADTDSGVHFLDNWGLVHVLFHGSTVLESRAHGWFVKPGHALRELRPAPAFAPFWADEGDAVLDLLRAARCRPVRRATMAMLKARPEWTSKVPFDRILGLLEHPDEEVQSFGVELLSAAAGLESVPLAQWLQLLEMKNLAVLEAVCAVMGKVVLPERLSVEQLVGFACGPLGPVAKLGLAWLKPRTLTPAQALELARVKVAGVAHEAVAWARQQLSTRPDFDPEWILAFLDSPLREVREAAWTWFAEEERARRRVDLWAKLVETPYDDIRHAIVGHLELHAAKDRALRVLLAKAPLETVWATVLLNIHRGNRAKRLATSQIAEAIEREPARAPQLLPLLAVAARSVRAPEFRAGLAAVVRAAVRRPEVAAEVSRLFPELRIAT